MAPNPLNVIDIIYAELQSLFGTDKQQLFSLEFPGRVLDPATYSYSVKNAFAELTKPQPVVEAEFRLTDDLFDLAEVTGGPNGRTLASGYERALNALVPAIADQQVLFMQDRQRIRAWLEEEVQVELPGSDGKPAPQRLSRMELYNTFNKAYLDASEQWRQDKETQYELAINDPNPDQALEKYARWVSREAPVRERELESLFSDAVVRGYYHEIREMLGLIDVESPAEQLEQTKARMRASEGTSADETQSIWPVQLQPQDWFTALDTDFAPIDLLLDPQSLQTELVTKQTELDQLQEQYTMLRGSQSGDVAALQTQVANARTALDNATNAALGRYLDSVVSVARIYLEASGSGATSAALGQALTAATANKARGGGTLSGSDLDQLKTDAQAVNDAQQALTAASGRLAEVQAELAGAQASSQSLGLTALTAHMDSLRREIKYLQSLLTSTSAATALAASITTSNNVITYDHTKTPAYINATGTGQTPGNVLPDTIPGNWVTVIVKQEANKSSEGSTLSTSSSASNTGVNLFIGGYSSQKTSSQGQSSTINDASLLKIEIGMLATKVEIDRSGWFDPSIFEWSKSMFHVDGATGQRSVISDGTTDATNKDSILPAYPTAFVIVKDVTIVVSSATSDANTYGYVKQNLDSSSGGILCFSTSGATSSLTQSHRAFTVSDDNTVVIRIPQPQILAWFVDPVAKDQSGDYQKLPDTFLPAATGAPGAPTNGQIAAPVLTGMGSLAQPAQAAAVDDGQSSAPSQA